MEPLPLWRLRVVHKVPCVQHDRIEKLNKPAVGICSKNFINDAASAASGKGMPVSGLLPETLLSECTDMREIEAAINPVTDDIVAALTRR